MRLEGFYVKQTTGTADFKTLHELMYLKRIKTEPRNSSPRRTGK